MLATTAKRNINYTFLFNVNISKKKSLKDQIKEKLKNEKSYSSTKEIWNDVDNW